MTLKQVFFRIVSIFYRDDRQSVTKHVRNVAQDSFESIFSTNRTSETQAGVMTHWGIVETFMLLQY